MRCGKGHDHETLEQVKACYGINTYGRQAALRDFELVTPSGFEVDDRSFDAEIQRRELEETRRVAEFKMRRDEKLIGQPPVGTFTLVKPDGTYRTMQIGPAKWANDAIVASYLSGPDNELNYTSFAFVKPGGRFNMFKRFRDNADLRIDLDTLLSGAEVRDVAHAAFLDQAEAYALKSGRCMRCTRKLTVPASLHRGLGPVCANIEGVN